jgi:hypothetical protein
MYKYNYHNSRHIMSNVRTSQDASRLRYVPNQLMLSIGLRRWYIHLTATILDIIHRPVFYLKLTMGNIRMSHDTYYHSATSPTG